jgi:uncharacterized damage-inducible protein DinB
MQQMTPAQAQFLISFLVDDFDRESKTTLKVLSALPAGQESYTPDSRSMHALKLAWHIASADVMFLNGIATGTFPSGDSAMPESIQSLADVAAWYGENIPKAIDLILAMSPEACSSVIGWGDTWKLPAPAWLQLAIKHSIHHRGQLSSYIRPMGGKVPAIYGPSGDEK